MAKEMSSDCSRFSLSYFRGILLSPPPFPSPVMSLTYRTLLSAFSSPRDISGCRGQGSVWPLLPLPLRLPSLKSQPKQSFYSSGRGRLLSGGVLLQAAGRPRLLFPPPSSESSGPGRRLPQSVPCTPQVAQREECGILTPPAA